MENQQDNHPLYAAINRKLAAVLATTPLPPAWLEAWLRLAPQSTDEERLAVYRAIRDSGVLPAEAGFFLVSWLIDAMTLPDAEDALRVHEERIEAVRRQHGLTDDEPWPDEQEPPEFTEAVDQLHDAWDVLYAAKLEQLGEPLMAKLLREDRDAFEQQSEAGRAFFHGPRSDEEGEEDDWLDGLMEAVSGCIEADGPMGPMGMRYAEEDGFWEITVYPTPVELIGGADDGAVVEPGFTLDLEQLRTLFDPVTACGWHALGLPDWEGPYVYVEGTCQGREVYLQILAYAPEDEEPGMKLDTKPPQRRRD